MDPWAADFLLAEWPWLTDTEEAEELTGWKSWGRPEAGAYARAMLAAFVAVGLAGDREASEWLANGPPRWPSPPPPSDRLREAVATRVERMVTGRELRGDGPWDETTRVGSLTATLRALDLLDEGFAERLRAEARERSRKRQRDLPTHPPFTGRRLLRVLIGPPVRQRGLRITGAELYTDGVMVRWHRAQLGRACDGSWPTLADETQVPDPSWALAPRLRLFDSLGTVYLLVAGDGGAYGDYSGLEFTYGGTAFTPGVSEEAGALWACQGDDRFELLGGP